MWGLQTEGKKKFKAIGVSTDITPPASPCGTRDHIFFSLRGSEAHEINRNVSSIYSRIC